MAGLLFALSFHGSLNLQAVSQELRGLNWMLLWDAHRHKSTWGFLTGQTVRAITSAGQLNERCTVRNLLTYSVPLSPTALQYVFQMAPLTSSAKTISPASHALQNVREYARCQRTTSSEQPFRSSWTAPSPPIRCEKGCLYEKFNGVVSSKETLFDGSPIELRMNSMLEHGKTCHIDRLLERQSNSDSSCYDLPGLSAGVDLVAVVMTARNDRWTSCQTDLNKLSPTLVIIAHHYLSPCHKIS